MEDDLKNFDKKFKMEDNKKKLKTTKKIKMEDDQKFHNGRQ